jgi:hypothetical protein
MEARALDDAKEFLAEQLKDGPRPATEIMEAAKEEGIAIGTLRRARESMNVKVRRPGKGIKSIWSLNNECQPGV